MAHGQSFPKRERLVSRKLIDELFNGSRSMAAFPLRAVYKNKVRACEQEPMQLLISVPKKRFHHAVDRNRVKRQIREAYRRHRYLLDDMLTDNRQLLLAFIWTGEQHVPTAEIEHRVVQLMKRIVEKERSLELS